MCILLFVKPYQAAITKWCWGKTPFMHLQSTICLNSPRICQAKTLTLFHIKYSLLNLIISQFWPPKRRVYFSTSQPVAVRLAKCIDRFVRGQVIVAWVWSALIASGLLQDQFVWLSLEARAWDSAWGREVSWREIWSPCDVWSASSSCGLACWRVSVFCSVYFCLPQPWRSIMRPVCI